MVRENHRNVRLLVVVLVAVLVAVPMVGWVPDFSMAQLTRSATPPALTLPTAAITEQPVPAPAAQASTPPPATPVPPPPPPTDPPTSPPTRPAPTPATATTTELPQGTPAAPVAPASAEELAPPVPPQTALEGEIELVNGAPTSNSTASPTPNPTATPTPTPCAAGEPIKQRSLPGWKQYTDGIEDCTSDTRYPFAEWVNKSAGTIRVVYGGAKGCQGTLQFRCAATGDWADLPRCTGDLPGGAMVAPDIVDAISEPGQPCLDIAVRCGKTVNVLTRTPSPTQVARATRTTKPLFGIPTTWESEVTSKAPGAPNILFYMIDTVSWPDFNKANFPLTSRFLKKMHFGSPFARNFTMPEELKSDSNGERVAPVRDTQIDGICSADTQPTLLTGRDVIPEQDQKESTNWEAKTRFQQTNFMKIAKEKGYGVTASFYPTPAAESGKAPELPWMGVHNQTALQYIHTRDQNGTTTVQPLNDVVHWNFKSEGEKSTPGCVRQSHELDHNNEMIEALFHPRQQPDLVGPSIAWVSDQTCHSSNSAQLAYSDYRLASTLRQLSDTGALEDTVVILAADHGPTSGFWNFDVKKIKNRHHPLLVYLIPPSESLLKASADVRGSYNEYVEKTLGRRPISDEYRKKFANMVENSKKNMRCSHADTFATVIDLVTGSADEVAMLKKKYPWRMFPLLRSLAVNYTEKAQGNATILENFLRPTCREMDVRPAFCRYLAEEKDMLPLLQSTPTVVHRDRGGRKRRSQVKDKFVYTFLKFLSDKVEDVSRTKAVSITSDSGVTMTPTSLSCAACIGFSDVASQLTVNITGLWRLTPEDGTTGHFAFTADISVPEALSLLSHVGNRTLRFVGKSSPKFKYSTSFGGISDQDSLLEFGSSTVDQVTRTSRYKPDQDACGEDAVKNCGLSPDKMQWCACRSKPRANVGFSEAPANANNDDVSLPLVNDPRYIKIFRRDLCKPGSQGEPQRPSAMTIPSCPPPMRDEYQGETGKQKMPDVDWTKEVADRYQAYSARCNLTDGLMWGSLQKYDVLRWMGRMTDLIFNGRPGEPEVPKKDEEKKSKLNWLDWASGCGANLFYYHASYQNYTKPGAEFHAVGVDITGPAIDWGRQKLRSMYPDTDMGADASRVPRVGGGSPNTMRFCHADGTKLEWLPKNSFDVITSLAGLYHLPTAAVCPTMRQLIALLKPKSGRLVTCYVHPEERYMQILNCLHECGEGMKVKGTLIDQNKLVAVEPVVELGLYSRMGANCLLLERL